MTHNTDPMDNTASVLPSSGTMSPAQPHSIENSPASLRPQPLAQGTTPTQMNELKTSALDRRLSIAKTSLTIGRRWASNGVTGLFLSKEDKAQRNQAFRQEQAQYLVAELGKLKGSVVKIGQMLALYGEHFLPQEITQALHHLNDNTASLSWTVIERTLRSQLGDKLDLMQVDPIPIGTASLAQVHRATIIDTGEQVVLKIQYPGVAEAIDSDLGLFKNLLKVTNVVPQTRALDEWFNEIQDLLHTEVNYATEAATTQRFYQRLKDDPRYIVPRILPAFCTDRVLCMSYESGVPLTDERVLALPAERRYALGQAALEILLKEIFVWGEMQTDPNFGNYLIGISEDGTPDKLILLDFGAMRGFDAHLLSIARGLMRAGYRHDKTAMTEAMQGYPFFDTMSTIVRRDMAQVFLTATEPFSDPAQNRTLAPELLDAQGRYCWAKSQLHNRVMEQASEAMASLEFSLPPKEFMFISRKFIGAYTLMTVLDAHTDCRPIMTALMGFDTH